MKKRRKKSEEGGSNWMDTYGDMVTLLLCFFVLLYSISSVDQSKWIKLVESFNPEAKKVSQIVTDTEVEADDEVPGGVNADEQAAFDELHDRLKQAVQDAGIESEVELTKGDGYSFVRFRDTMFFDGDSSIIRPEGKQILDIFAAAIAPAGDIIQEIQILGHTTQALPDVQNDVVSDRVLSAERAANVTGYIQNKNILSPDKLVSVGYGQFRPVAPFDTEANRSKNRRVELIITKNNSVQRSLDEYYAAME
ncbi:OmpA/MotB family protein [Mediterraneibacter agrestimuris]|uniref:OmpA/MotB family protein n=1 Tax=Mediterraneibacter agrestimuris TaxID=2941333 RepID=UPI00203C11A3|nr:flagellar motor protein MotB [Mediterraneibacter agrestimuris]